MGTDDFDQCTEDEIRLRKEVEELQEELGEKEGQLLDQENKMDEMENRLKGEISKLKEENQEAKEINNGNRKMFDFLEYIGLETHHIDMGIIDGDPDKYQILKDLLVYTITED